jgi:TonB family protein
MSVRSTKWRAPRLLAILPLALLTVHAAAQVTEPDLRARLLNKPLYLRRPWAQDHLKFDATGKNFTKNESFIPFSLCGIDIVQVQLKKDKLVINGNRIGLEFNRSVTRVSLGDTINIEIAAPSGTDFGPALDNIFAETLSDLAPSLPPYWQTYARKNLMAAALLPPDPQHPGETPEDSAPNPPKHIGGGVTAPVVLSQVDPAITVQARQFKFSGKITLRFYIREDGSPSNVQILTPVGLGMDEQAVAAAYRYRFKPAMRDGKPIRAELILEVNFQTF